MHGLKKAKKKKKPFEFVGFDLNTTSYFRLKAPPFKNVVYLHMFLKIKEKKVCVRNKQKRQTTCMQATNMKVISISLSPSHLNTLHFLSVPFAHFDDDDDDDNDYDDGNNTVFPFHCLLHMAKHTATYQYICIVSVLCRAICVTHSFI